MVEQVYQVSSIVCSGCKEAVEAELSQIDGVEAARVDIPTGSVTVWGNAPFTALQVAVSKSERVLTPLGSFCVKLHVDGMMCGHCTAKVEQALQAVVGVASVKVDLKAELATVVGTATSAALIHAIETTGHAAKVVEPDKAPASPRVLPSKTTLTVRGMSCGHCSAKVEKALHDVEGVLSAQVDLEAALAIVVGTAPLAALLAAVEKAGLTAASAPLRPTTTTLSVGGMMCDHCTAKVEKSLQVIEGVISTQVDLATGLATIVGTVPLAALIAAVEATGHPTVVASAVASAVEAGTAGPSEGLEGTGLTHKHAADSSVTLQVDGMFCEACRATIKRELSALPGVTFVAVNLHWGIVTVRGTSSVEELIESISSAGRFTAHELASGYDDFTGLAADPFAPTPAAKGARAEKLIKLLVIDMLCSGCKDKVDRAARMVRGVAHVDIDLDTHVLSVSGQLATEDVLAAVKAAGYEPCLLSEDFPAKSSEACPVPSPGASPAASLPKATEGKVPKGKKVVKDHLHEVSLTIDGMTCASCVGAVEGGLLSLEGVHSATVSLMGKSGKVAYDARCVDVPAILARVVKTGYAAELQADNIEAVAAASNFGIEIAYWWRMFAGSMVFTLPVFLISMVFRMIPSTSPGLYVDVAPGLAVSVLVNLILTTPVQLYYGFPFHRGACASLRRCHFTMDVLVSIGTFAAYIYSIIFMFVSIGTRGEEGVDHEFFETAAVLITFILLGKYLESAAKGKASNAITQLLTLVPPTALQLASCREIDLDATEVPVSGLRKGDVVKVLPGAQMPVDGTVLFGESAVNESMITGESLPQPKRKNDKVVGGTINGSGVLYVLVTAVGADTTLAQIMRVVADAQHRKPRIQAVADRISAVFVPVVITLAIFTWAAWAIAGATGNMPDWSGDDDLDMMSFSSPSPPNPHAGHNMPPNPPNTPPDPHASHNMPPDPHVSNNMGSGGGSGGGGHGAMSMGVPSVEDPQLLAFMFGCAVLVIACPCALGLATPTAVMVGGGVGAAHGILIKGGDVLELAAAVQTICFDKTGTLTTGKLSVARVLLWAQGVNEAILLRAAGSAERGSEHPIAKAIINHAELFGVQTAEPADFVAAAGQGLQCVVDGKTVLMGNRSWMEENGLKLSDVQEAEVAALESRGHTVVLAALSGPPDANEVASDAKAATAPTTPTEAAMDATVETAVARRARWRAAVAGKPDADADTATIQSDPKSMGTRLFIAGALAVADSLKPDAPAVVKQLTQLGMKVWMISGDNERTAAHIAAQAGIDLKYVVAGVKPAGKLAKVQELRDAGAKIAFVGDGINDAPALAAADVGIAVGSGTDVAIEAADVVLMKEGLQDVVTALDLSKVVMRRIRINFVWAFGYNVVGIPLAAGVLFPGLGIQLPPMFAGGAMALSSVSVVCSSLLLRFYQPPRPLSMRRQVFSRRSAEPPVSPPKMAALEELAGPDTASAV